MFDVYLLLLQSVCNINVCFVDREQLAISGNKQYPVFKRKKLKLKTIWDKNMPFL